MGRHVPGEKPRKKLQGFLAIFAAVLCDLSGKDFALVVLLPRKAFNRKEREGFAKYAKKYYGFGLRRVCRHATAALE
jgi:hypothetical protein